MWRPGFFRAAHPRTSARSKKQWETVSTFISTHQLTRLRVASGFAGLLPNDAGVTPVYKAGSNGQAPQQPAAIRIGGTVSLAGVAACTGLGCTICWLQASLSSNRRSTEWHTILLLPPSPLSFHHHAQQLQQLLDLIVQTLCRQSVRQVSLLGEATRWQHPSSERPVFQEASASL